MHSLFLKIQNWFQKEGESRHFTIKGIDLKTWASINNVDGGLWKNPPNKTIIICENDSQCTEILKALPKEKRAIVFLSPENSPYDSFLEVSERVSSYTSTINTIYSLNFDILLTTLSGLFLSTPPFGALRSKDLLLKKEAEISPFLIKTKLLEIGYHENIQAAHPGTFSHKGEVFDIYPSNGEPVRLQFFDDLIENIYPIDPSTFKSSRDNELDQVQISETLFSFYQESLVNNLRKNIPQPPVKFKEKYLARQNLFRKIQNQEIFDNATYFFPFFFKEQSSLYNFLKDKGFFIFENYEINFQNFENYLEKIQETYEEEFTNEKSDIILPPPNKIFLYPGKKDLLSLKSLHVDQIHVSENIEESISNEVAFNTISLRDFVPFYEKKSIFIENLFSKINKEIPSFSNFYFFYSNKQNLEKFSLLLENYNIPKTKIQYCKSPLDEGFYHPGEQYLVLSDQQLFEHKNKRKNTRSKKKKYDLFAEQIATLQVNDFVVHKNHGVGKYLGIQNLAVSSDKSDFLVIQYKDDDKVYVPVYNLNLIQKYADSSTECKVADLKSKKFEQEKVKAKKSVKKLAFDLIKLQAERETYKGYPFNEPGEEYHRFEQKFPYELTPDQEQSINDILDDMSNIRPMDRLVCGDVGFGKTEVAMRAAFKAVEDNKQVAILVPTTILCLQHYMNFKERFKEFPVNIEYLSRLKTSKESNHVIEKTNNGSIDIIIGTHKLLSSKLKYKDLGLVIIDEEHRFGVAHKEKLKTLKSSIDFLTLTATPIPRTLQLSFLGIKELSLIQTPPPKRQSINSYLIRHDKHTLKNAIENELKRGGQVFFIHNKVKDIEIISSKIKELAPSARIVYAHGQLNEKDLEKRIFDFYQKKYDILISTTIVESGIDIPTANTMIINNAHQFGLAQLHQLRGRIGRSQRKAYCYFVIPKHRKITDIASKRLEALQKYADLGSGFAIANSDLDIRGAGNLLGAEQSGHITKIGLELYLEMLEEAVNTLKGEKKSAHSIQVDVQSFFPCYIPDHYIQDQQVRLKYYKKISNCKNPEEVNEAREELEDIFGTIPETTTNLLNLSLIAIAGNLIGAKQIKIKENEVELFFSNEFLDKNELLRSNIATFFLKNPTLYRLRPNSSVLIKNKKQNSQEYATLIQNISGKLLVNS